MTVLAFGEVRVDLVLLNVFLVLRWSSWWMAMSEDGFRRGETSLETSDLERVLSCCAMIWVSIVTASTSVSAIAMVDAVGDGVDEALT